MKLYYTPGACSMAAHIVAEEAGLALDLVKVDLRSKKTADDRDYLAVNPKGYVPALELDDGQVLTEVTVVMQYLADRKPASGLAPPHGTFERYRLLELLAYISSELHKSYSPLFNPKTSPEARQERMDYLNRRFAFLDKALAGKTFLTGDTFTVADAYLFVLTNWANIVKLDLSAFPHLLAFRQRVSARPAVLATLQAEGFTK
jgi:glutathione S-transferase